MTKDEFYISRCFELAKNSIGRTTPNPLVGAVIVKDGNIISEGFHHSSGRAHAEVEAINNSKQDISGATLYCNLEPCCHMNKKTPPCTEVIIKNKFKKVVIANFDPNPEVAGKGIQKLKEAGIQIVSGVLEKEGALLNEVFFTHITKKRPFVHLKWAQTLDGKMATQTGSSKWITGELARNYCHQERNLYDAIIVGANTANNDDPSLTIRLNDSELSKKRIIISPSGNIRKDLKLFNDQYKSNTIIVTNTQDYFGVQKLPCPIKNGSLDIQELLSILYQEGICSVYVEGGAALLKSFITQSIYERISTYIAPKLIGEGLSPTSGFQSEVMNQALNFNKSTWTVLGNDICLESEKNICLQV